MATIDLTLNSFIVPRMATFTPPWGTVQTDQNHPGLSTQEAVNNMMMAFNRMRPVIVTENSTTTVIEADATILLTGSVLSLTLGTTSYTGCELKIINKTDHSVNILDGADVFTSAPGEVLPLIYDGRWSLNVWIPVGTMIVQYPDEKTPKELRLPGTWEVWSNKAVIYGLRSTNSGSASIYIERQKCGNLLTASDLAVGAQVSSGAYAGYYVREVVTLAGKFTSIEGGSRPTFISGGVGQDQIRSIDGSYEFFSSSTTGVAGINPQGSITIAAGSVSYYNQISSTNYATTLFKINTPNPGPDVAPKTLSARYWRCIA